MLPVPLHARDHGQREGREAEAVAAPGSAGQGAQVKMNLDRCVDLCKVVGDSVQWFAGPHAVRSNGGTLSSCNKACSED